jgi:hypothetical protein
MSQLAEETLDLPPEYHGRGITTQTKFMQQYRVASPVDGGRQGCAVRNSDGQIELFTVATNRTVWNVSPDPSSDTGYRQINTGMRGDVVAAAMDHDDSIVVFAGNGWNDSQTLSYWVKHADGTTLSKQLNLPTQSTFKGLLPVKLILEIQARTIDGRLYVAVLGRCWADSDDKKKLPASIPYLALSNWSLEPGRFRTTQNPWPSLPSNTSMPWDWVDASTGFWTRTIQSNAPIGFSCYIHPYRVGRDQLPVYGFFTFDLNCQPIEFIFADQPYPVESAAVDLEEPDWQNLARNRIFAITRPDATGPTGGRRLYDLRSPFVPAPSGSTAYFGTTYTWHELFPGPSRLGRVRAVHDHNQDPNKSGTHLFCVSNDLKLYHFPPNPYYNTVAPYGYDTLPPPIKQNVSWIAVARNDAGNIELFCAQSGASARLLHLTLDQDTGDWEEQCVEVQSTTDDVDKLEEFISYSTDISATDEVGAPLANAPVTVRASDRTTITVNGATTEVDQSLAANLNLNAIGQLSITQETHSLGVPALWVHIEGLMPADQVLIVEQYGDGHDEAALEGGSGAGLPVQLMSIEKRLATVTETELKNAKDAAGKPLLKHQESAGAFANAFNQCMQLPDRQKSRAGALHPLLARQGTRTGVHIGSPAVALERLSVIPRPDLPSWTLTFEEPSDLPDAHE